jgi:hypothetical protein
VHRSTHLKPNTRENEKKRGKKSRGKKANVLTIGETARLFTQVKKHPAKTKQQNDERTRVTHATLGFKKKEVSEGDACMLLLVQTNKQTNKQTKVARLGEQG